MFERNDRYLGLGCILLGVAGYISASKWKVMLGSDPAGPAAIPKILCVGFILIGLILLVSSLLMKNPEKTSLFSKGDLYILLLLTAISFAYLIVLPFIGYLLATPMLIAGILLSLGIRNVKTIVLVSVIGTLVLFFLFYSALKVNLPLGFMKKFIAGLGLRW
ncbi:MAG: tripartite tricarboxylate transporter TctB family protein [Bacillota bacterium]